MDESISIDGQSLSIEEVVKVARREAPVRLADQARQTMEAARAVVDRIAADQETTVYGINTGFGSLKDVVIKATDLAHLQRNLLMSHSAGVGRALSVEVVRAAMLLRANALAKGYSGVRPAVVETLLEMLNKKVHPYIPEQGSVGASGDLAPLSHLALVLSMPPEESEDDPRQSGEVIDSFGVRVPGSQAMEAAGIARIVLSAKEGLALNNGVQISGALALLALIDAERLVRLADLACAMTVEAVLGTPDAFKPEVHAPRPFVGQKESAAAIIRHLAGSELAGSDPKRMQDGYSIRCAPQVHGAARDLLGGARNCLAIEINSASDNPLIVQDQDQGTMISAGQFHGEPVAFAGEQIKLAVSELVSISERRTFRLLTKALSFGLPSLLAPPDRSGLGLMAVQFTAAGLVADCKHLAHPAVADSIPTCEDQEDHVSMSPIAARGARQIVENAAYVLAAELFCAARALAIRRKEGKLHLGENTTKCLKNLQLVLNQDAAGAPPAMCLEEIRKQIGAGEFDHLLGEVQ
ncbi:MAG: HAL/PAL/TAL family ammonia-lyase [Alphaproteobacteria bacterium]